MRLKEDVWDGDYNKNTKEATVTLLDGLGPYNDEGTNIAAKPPHNVIKVSSDGTITPVSGQITRLKLPAGAKVDVNMSIVCKATKTTKK